MTGTSPIKLRDPGGRWAREVHRYVDEARTGRVRCIGCGKFVSRRRNWNQCPDCDTREPESY